MYIKCDVLEVQLKESYGGLVSVGFSDMENGLDATNKPMSEALSNTKIKIKIKDTSGNISLANGKNLRELNGFLEITKGVKEHGNPNGIGPLIYSENVCDKSYEISIGLPEAQFETLLRCCLNKLTLSELFISLRDIASRGVGNEIWDTQATPFICVLSIEWSVMCVNVKSEF